MGIVAKLFAQPCHVHVDGASGDAGRVHAPDAGEDLVAADRPPAVDREVTQKFHLAIGELAALAGYPGAARAVGTFCARNAFAFFLPCHRVVASDGIGGYGSAGIAVKRRLLALEGVTGLAA